MDLTSLEIILAPFFAGYTKYAVGIGIFVAAIIGAYIIVLIMKLLAHVASKTKTQLDDILIEASATPIKLVAIMLGAYFSINYLSPNLEIMGVSFASIFYIVMIFFSAYLVTKVLKAGLRWYSEEVAPKTTTSLDEHILPIFSKIIVVFIYIIALILVLHKLGIEVTPILAGLGVAGIAIALALQPMLSNLFSGFSLISDRPIKVGDFIKLSTGEDGYVEEIGWRSVRMRTLGGNLVTVPNNKIADSIITNYSMPEKPTTAVIEMGVAYGSDLDKVERVLLKTVKAVIGKSDGGIMDFEPLIRFTQFADNQITVKIVFKVEDYVKQFKIKSDMIKEIHKTFGKEKIEIPFPQRVVWMKRR